MPLSQNKQAFGTPLCSKKGEPCGTDGVPAASRQGSCCSQGGCFQPPPFLTSLPRRTEVGLHLQGPDRIRASSGSPSCTKSLWDLEQASLPIKNRQHFTKKGDHNVKNYLLKWSLICI